MRRPRITRRRLLGSGLQAWAAGTVAAAFPGAIAARRQGAPAIVRADSARPSIEQGVASGDVSTGRGLIWSRTDRPARMLVEYSTTDKFDAVLRRTGPAALPSTDFTARVILTDLPADQRIFYRVTFQDLADLRTLSETRTGQLSYAANGR